MKVQNVEKKEREFEIRSSLTNNNGNGGESKDEKEKTEQQSTTILGSAGGSGGSSHFDTSSSTSTRNRQAQLAQKLKGPSPPLAPTHMACLKIDVEELRRLLNTDRTHVNQSDKVGNSPLHIAAGAGAKQCLILLLDYGAKVDLQNHNGLAPLHLAVRHYQPECFEILIERGAKITIPNNDWITPIHLAAKYGKEDLLIMMVNRLGFKDESATTTNTGDVINVPEENEMSKSEEYCDYQHPKANPSKSWMNATPISLEAVPNNETSKRGLNIVDSWGQTPLHYGAIQKQLSCVNVLLRYGANPTIRDATGMTPLLSATVSGSRDCLAALVKEHPQGLRDKNKSGKNVFHLAVDSGFTETVTLIIQLLLDNQYGDDIEKMINEKDLMGATPYISAKPEIQTILQKHGAKDIGLEMEDVSCAICRQVMHRSVTLACGHSFCRVCIQEWRKQNDSCPKCRSKVRLVGGYMQNWRYQKEIEGRFAEEVRQKEEDSRGDGMECTIENVAMFGKALGTEIVLDKNHTTILAIDNEFPMHLTFMAKKKRLCVYSPLLGGWGKNQKESRRVAWKLMRYSGKGLFGDGMGGVGVIVGRELIVFHLEIPMEWAASDTLRKMSIPYVEIVKRWREMSKLISANKPVDKSLKQKLLSTKLFSVPPACGIDNIRTNIAALTEESESNPTQIKFVVNAIDEGATKWKVDVQGEVVTVEYNSETDLLELTTIIMERINKAKEDDSEDEVENLFGLYQNFLSGAVFGHKTAGGVFCVEKVDKSGEMQMDEVKKEYRLLLKNRVRLNRTGETSFSKNGLKEVLPMFASQSKGWRKIAEPWVAV